MTTDGGAARGAMRSLTIDYTEDELDALADLFGVPALGSARLRRPPATGTEEAVLRATLATATRCLVARRAMVLSGTAIKPKVELLDPHATILRAFLGSSAVVRVERRVRDEVERWVVFLRDDVAVEQRAIAGRAILRMTAHPAEAAEQLVCGPLEFGDVAADAGGDPLELSVRTLARTADDLPPEAPERVRDLIYARRQQIDVTVVRRRDTAVERSWYEWLDAGTLGLWSVERDEDGVTARLTPTTADVVRQTLAMARAPEEAAR